MPAIPEGPINCPKLNKTLPAPLAAVPNWNSNFENHKQSFNNCLTVVGFFCDNAARVYEIVSINNNTCLVSPTADYE
jgi:hypothetical protein